MSFRSHRHAIMLMILAACCWPGSLLANQNTSLMSAVLQGDNQALIDRLVEASAQEVTGPSGRRALLHAAAVGKLQTVQTLLEFGADPNTRSTDKLARTALILAAAGDLREAQSLCRNLIAAGSRHAACDEMLARSAVGP